MLAYQKLRDEVATRAAKRALRRTPSGAPPGDPTGTPGEEGKAEVGPVCVTKFITLKGNIANTGCLARVSGKSTDDSDTEACGGDCYSLESLVISKRNNATMDKFG